jgi:flagellar L-ring protein precursor FlgH
MTLVMLILIFGPASWASGQSSSLFKRYAARRTELQGATTRPATNGALQVGAGPAAPQMAGRNQALARASLMAVELPEPKVIKVNDLVGVIVRYRLRHQSRAKIKQESEWELNAELAAWFRLHDSKWTNQPFRAGKPEIKFKNENELDNKGRAERKDLFETRIMAKVIDVKPNGNLIIVAWQNMTIDKEVQYLRLTGECHSKDITPDGNITSDKVFALDVQTMNEGAVRDAVKRGWFKELLDTWKPF